MTGENTRLAPFRITHAFIYVLDRGCETGQSIYRCDRTPKLVVTDVHVILDVNGYFE
jgi:hypothetical protein